MFGCCFPNGFVYDSVIFANIGKQLKITSVSTYSTTLLIFKNGINNNDSTFPLLSELDISVWKWSHMFKRNIPRCSH